MATYPNISPTSSPEILSEEVSMHTQCSLNADRMHSPCKKPTFRPLSEGRKTVNPDSLQSQALSHSPLIALSYLSHSSFVAIMRILMVVVMMMGWGSAWGEEVTATWNFKTMGASTVSINGGLGVVPSDIGGVPLYVDGTSGKLETRSSDAQMNNGCKIRVPVVSTSDVVTVVSYPDYHNYTVAGVAADENTETHTATNDDVSAGYVEIAATNTAYLYTISVSLNYSYPKTYKWDFSQSSYPATAIQNRKAVLFSNNDGTKLPMEVDASLGKLANNGSNSQVNATTIFKIPVASTSDVITITNYSTDANQYNATYTIGTETGINLQTKTYSPSKAEVVNGYATMTVTGNGYICGIQVTQQEKQTFTDPVLNISSSAIDLSCPSYVPSKSSKVTLTGSYLTNGTYTVTQPSVAGLTITPAEFTVADGTVNQEFTIAYTSETTVASATADFTFATSDENTSVKVTATYSNTVQREVEQSTVSEETTWDFAGLISKNIQLTGSTSPSNTEEFVYAKLGEVKNDDSFNSQALMVKGTWVYYTGNGGTIQPTYVKFKTSVAGKVYVKFVNPNGSNDTRTLMVNGASTSFISNSSSWTEASDISVDAGDVTITGNNELRISKITFTPQASDPTDTNLTALYDAVVTDVEGLKTALAAASGTSRYKIFIKNGTYDLGTTVDTKVKDYTTLVGESRDGVLIKNTPNTEGIGNYTATLEAGSNVIMQNLTLQCTVPSGANERGTSLYDVGTNNIYKNVRLLGRQDTYYSKSVNTLFEDCEIHGTVDFICGAGNVMFDRCTIVIEAQNAYITAACTAPSEKGYVFNNCTIKGDAAYDGKYYLGRPWLTAGNGDGIPATTFINTTMEIKPYAVGWTNWSGGSGTAQVRYHEYNSVDGTGAAVDLSGRSTANLGDGQSATTNDGDYTLTSTSGYSKTDVVSTLAITLPAAPANLTLTDNTLTWNAVTGASKYAVYNGTTLLGVTAETSFAVSSAAEANSRRINSQSSSYSVAAISDDGIVGTPAVLNEETPVTPAASDLAIADGHVTKAMTVGDADWTIAKGTDFTTSSTGAVTFTSSNTSVATVNETTGAVHAVAAGTATITITQAATDAYEGGSKTITVTVSAAAAAEFQNFEIDLTKNPVGTLPAGVTQISYPQNGASFNGAQHGWCWYAIEFDVDGPVLITLGGCQYINDGYEGYVKIKNGEKLDDIPNKTAKCYDADKVNNVGTYLYTGDEATLQVYCGQYCPYVKVEKVLDEFNVDMTVAEPVLPSGVTQITYPGIGSQLNGTQHGWQGYAVQFAVTGSSDIYVGGCQYSDGGGYLATQSGTKIDDINNQTVGCGGVAHYRYEGEAAILKLYCGKYSPSIRVVKVKEDHDFTATWDWKTMPSEYNVTLQSTSRWLSSNEQGVSMYVGAASGKYRANGSNVQLTKNAALVIPVFSKKDKISVEGYSGMTHFKIHGTEYSADVTDLPVNDDDVTHGYIEIISTDDNGYLKSVTLTHTAAPNIVPSFIATWNWNPSTPAELEGKDYSNSTSEIPSTVEGVKIKSIATSSSATDNGDNFMMTNGTELKIPAYSVGDLLELYFHGYGDTWGNTKINDGSALTSQSVTYYATEEDVERGYIKVSATATVYLYHIKLYHNNIEEFENITFGNLDKLISANTEYYIDATGTPVYSTTLPEKGYYNAALSAAAVGNGHGLQNTTMHVSLPQPGYYTLILGGCQFSNGNYTFKVNNAVLQGEETTNARTGACYAEGNSNSYIKRSIKVAEGNACLIITASSNWVYLPYFSLTRSDKSECDLSVATPTASQERYTTYTLTKGVAYTTSSDGDITFTSSNPAVATIDADGKITALNEGETVITISQAESDAYLAGEATITITVTAATISETGSKNLTIGTDLVKLTGAYSDWETTVVYPKEFAVQGASFGNGDGSSESLHQNIANVGSIYFDVTTGSADGLALRTWIWDAEAKKVRTLYPNPLKDYSSVANWEGEYKIQDAGVYRVNVNDWSHLKGVKAANNWGAAPITVGFAFTEGLDPKAGTTTYTHQGDYYVTVEPNNIQEGWIVVSDGEVRTSAQQYYSGARTFACANTPNRGIYTRNSNGNGGSVQTATFTVPAGNVEIRALLANWSYDTPIKIEVFNSSGAVVATKTVTPVVNAEATRNNSDFQFEEVPVQIENAAAGEYYVKYSLPESNWGGIFVAGQSVYTYHEEGSEIQTTAPSFEDVEQGAEYILISHNYGDTYQWYDATSADLSGSTAIDGATKPYIRYQANKYGDHYVYCVVTSGPSTGSGQADTKTRTGYAHFNVPEPPIRFIKNLEESYEVYPNNNVKLEVEAVAGMETPAYQWYINYKNDNPDEATPIDDATAASYDYCPTEVGTTWLFCKATHNETVENSAIAKIITTAFSFKPFELDLRKAKLGKGTVTKYIYVNDKGNVEIYDDAPARWNAKIEATYHDDQHGYNSFKATIPVTGPVEASIGGCAYNGGTNKITIKDFDTQIVPSETGDCWDQSKKVGTAYYTNNESRTLTITGPQYTPYFSIKALTGTVKTPTVSATQTATKTTITLATETADATIKYKVNPSTGSGQAPTKQTYSVPVEITSDCTLTIWAEKTGYANSEEVTYEVKIIGENAVAYIYDSKYSTYCGLEKDPLYAALSANTTDWNLVPFDINGMGAADVDKLSAYKALLVTEAQSGSGAFGLALKKYADGEGTDDKPMVSLKTFFMGNGASMDRWAWGSAYNPSHDGKGVSTINAKLTGYRNKALFEGVMFSGENTNLFNTDAEEYVKANHLQGVKEFKSNVTGSITKIATVTGNDGTEYTTIFARGEKFINIGMSYDNITEINQNGIRIVSNALKLVMNDSKSWNDNATAGTIITGIQCGSHTVDASEMGALSNCELAIPMATPNSITITTNGSNITSTKDGDFHKFTFNGKTDGYKIGFSDATIASITIGGHALTKWDGTGSTLDIPRTGELVITFTKAMADNPIVNIDGKNFVGVASDPSTGSGQAKTYTFHYLLDYSTTYSVNILPPTFRTATGVAFITPIRFSVRTEGAAAIAKAGFDYIVDTNLPSDYNFNGVPHGDINAAIAAANAATTSATQRFRIFVPNGTYQVKNSTGATDANGMTTLTKSYISLIGQDMEKTIIVNKPTTEAIHTTATLHLKTPSSEGGIIKDIYIQDITLKNNYKDMLIQSGDMRAVSLWNEDGQGTILKNVKLWSNQDTYYNSAQNSNDYNTYFETSTITGTVDFICGNGNNWFEQCNLVLNNRDKNVIVAPNTQTNQTWGMVFNGCTVDKATGASKVSDWWLGRPWNYEPRATFLNTTFNVLPTNAGWTSMTNDLKVHFREYGSMDKNGNSLDLSGRSLGACSATAGSEGPLMSAADATGFTIDAMFGTIDPRIHTTQVQAPSIYLESAKVIGWDDMNDALCYFVFVDDKLVNIQTTTTFNVTQNGTYTVRAANERGGLGAASNSIRFTTDIPTSWTFGKETWRNVSTEYWTAGTEEVGTAPDNETLSYQSLQHEFEDFTNAENGAQLMESSSIFLQSTNGLRFFVNGTFAADKLRYYSTSANYPERTGIKANGEDIVIRIPILKGFPMMKITIDGVNHYIATRATGSTEKGEGELVPKEDLQGYLNYTLESGHTISGITLMKSSSLDDPSVSQSPIYDPAAKTWTYTISHSYEYARIKYYIGELTFDASGNPQYQTLTDAEGNITNTGQITVGGGDIIHVLVEDGQATAAFGPSSITDVTAPSTDEVINVNYIPDGVLGNKDKQFSEDMNLKLSKAFSVKASGILYVDGEFLPANTNGTVELSTPTTGTLSIVPSTFKTDAQGKMSQWFVVYYEGNEVVAEPAAASLTFKIDGVAKNVRKNGKGDALAAYPFTYQRKEAKTTAATPTPVTTSTTWDWTKKTGNAINWSTPATDEPHRYEFVVPGNVSGMNDNTVAFDANKLITQGQVQFRTDARGNHFMGDYVSFKTKASGTLRVTVGTSNPTADRRLIVKVGGQTVTTNYKEDENGQRIWDNETWHFFSQDQKTLADIPVELTDAQKENGVDVEITSMLHKDETFQADGKTGNGDYIPENEPRPQYFWLYKIEFVADAVMPTIAVNTTDWKVTLTADEGDQIYYTLDGSEPTYESKLYTGPFDLPTNYTIKAKNLTVGKKASETNNLTTNYPLAHLTTESPEGHGTLRFTPSVDGNKYIQGFKVTLVPQPKMGYKLEKVATSNDKAAEAVATDNMYTMTTAAEQVLYAWFNEIAPRAVTMAATAEIQTAIESTGGNVTGYPDQLTSLSIPSVYTLYYPGHTLDYWYASTEADPENPAKKYVPGNNYDEAGDPITLYPHFAETQVSGTSDDIFDYRSNEVEIHWDLRTGYGCKSIRNEKTVGDIIMKLNTHTTVTYGSEDHVVDAALDVKPKKVGAFDNTDLDDWCTLRKGVEITLPSGMGAVYRLATYALLGNDDTSTLIDGKHFDGYTEATDENGVTYYIYHYTSPTSSEKSILTIGDDYGYYKYIEAVLPAADNVELIALTNNQNMGTVETEVVFGGKTQNGIATQEGARYSKGSAVTVTAHRVTYYELKNWEYYDEDEDTWKTVAHNGIYRNVTFDTSEAEKLKFNLGTFVKVRAVFGDKVSYYVNFSAGKFATGLPPQQVHIEHDELFEMPKANQTLYYDGHTLMYWEDAEGNRFDFGKSYTLTKNIVLYPVFEVNKYTLFDLGFDKEKQYREEATVTWNLVRSVDDGVDYLTAPYLNYEATSGVLVAQMHFQDTSKGWIDMPLYIDAKTNYGKFGSPKLNNYASETTCQVNEGTIITVPVIPEVEITLTAANGRQISETTIAGINSTTSGTETWVVGGAWGSQSVTVITTLKQPTRDIVFANDGQYYKTVSAKYVHGMYGDWNDGFWWVPRLNNDLKLNGQAVDESEAQKLVDERACTLKYTPQYGDNKMPTVDVTCSSNGYVDIVQPTVDNPTAIINLHATEGVLIYTYTVNLEMENSEQPVITNVKVGGQDASFNGGNFNVSGEVASSGTITIDFDHTMQETSLTNFNQIETATGNSKTLSFNFLNLEDGEHTFTADLSKLLDVYGQSCSGYKAGSSDAVQLDKINIHFTTSSSVHTVQKRLVDYVVNDNLTSLAKANLNGRIPMGSADNAFASANNAEGTDRFYIYVPEGDYKLTGNTTIKPDYTSDGAVPAKGDGSRWSIDVFESTYRGKDFANGITQITRSNVSLIGEGQADVRLWNLPVIEGISYTGTISIGQNTSGFYCQDMVIENAFPYKKSMDVQGTGSGAAGRAVAFWDKGNKTILKNVTMLSWQDTYFSNNAYDMRSYWEDCKIAGVVDFLCGDGDVWFERTELMLRDRSGNNIVAPRQPRTQNWGYVFNHCKITAENEAAATSNEGSYTLGRPWAYSPAATFLYTTMEVKPKTVGWNNMNTDDILRLHEYMSYKEDGETTVDLTGRSLRDCAPVAGSDDPLLTDVQAAKYSVNAAMAGSDLFNPQALTAQRPVVENFGRDDVELNWTHDSEALCYFIYKADSEDGEYKLFNITIDNSMTLETDDDWYGWYKIRAANEMGGLGEWSAAVQYDEVRSYELVLKNATNSGQTTEKGWSTICLPYNAKVPTANSTGQVPQVFKVYAATKINNNVITLQSVSYIDANVGYVVYGDAGTYVFKQSSHFAEHNTLLEGNPSDSALSASTVSCYTLSFKPNISGIGFYKYTGANLNPYKAYLGAVTFVEHNTVSDSETVVQQALKRGILFRFEDSVEPVDIKEIEADPTDPTPDDDRYYDLTGRPVLSPEKGGVYIRNRRKVVFR